MTAVRLGAVDDRVKPQPQCQLCDALGVGAVHQAQAGEAARGVIPEARAGHDDGRHMNLGFGQKRLHGSRSAGRGCRYQRAAARQLREYGGAALTDTAVGAEQGSVEVGDEQFAAVSGIALFHHTAKLQKIGLVMSL